MRKKRKKDYSNKLFFIKCRKAYLSNRLIRKDGKFYIRETSEKEYVDYEKVIVIWSLIIILIVAIIFLF